MLVQPVGGTCDQHEIAKWTVANGHPVASDNN